MTESDPEKGPAEPITAGEVGARRAPMGQELPDSVTGSLNVPQVRPAATSRPEAGTPSTADPAPAMLIWPLTAPPPRAHVPDDQEEQLRRMDEAPPINDVVVPREHSSPAPRERRPARSVRLRRAALRTQSPPRRARRRRRYAIVAAALAALAALRRHRSRSRHK